MPLGAVPFPFGKCKICQDKATGIHYGVATCEGCKGFFKRSIPKADKYKCFFGGQCDITPKNRNRCKACRFKLCLQFGMSVDAVKMGRIPKTEKDKALAEAARESISDDYVDGDHGIARPPASHHHQLASNIRQHDSYGPHSSYDHSYSTEEMHAGNPFMDADLDKYLPTTVDSQKMEYSENCPSSRKNARHSNCKEIEKGPISSYHNRPVSFNSKLKTQYSCPQSSSRQQDNNDAKDRSPRFPLNRSRSTHDNIQESSRYYNHSAQENGGQSSSGYYTEAQDSSPQSILRHRSSEAQNKSPESLMKQDNDGIQDNNVPLSWRHNITNCGVNNSQSQQLISQCESKFTESTHDSFAAPPNIPSALPPFEPGTNNQTNLQTALQLAESSSHFSSEVIEELVRQVLDTSEASRLANEQTTGMSSASIQTSSMSSDPVQTLNMSSASLQSLSLTDSHSEFTGRSHGNIDDFDGTLRRQYHDKENMYRKSTEHSDIGRHFNQDDSRINALRAETENMAISRSYNGSDESGNVTQRERTEEDAQESNALIDVTLERFVAPIKYLFSFQALNKECFRKQMEEECQFPFTTGDRTNLKFVWDELMAGVQNYNTQVMGFCSIVPGFSNFVKGDQEKLAMNAYMEIWMMIHAEFLTGQESYVLLNHKKIFYSKDTMTLILGEELTNLMLDFGRKFNQFNLSDFEIGLLCAVRLTSPEVEGLEQKDKVELLNSHFLDVFASVLNKTPNSSRLAISLFQCLPVLKTITTMQQEAIFNFNIDNPPEDVTREVPEISTSN